MSACVERLTTEAQLMAGLRGRAELAVGHGVVLEFPVESEICIFNDGVRWDIDAVYVGEDNVVNAIELGIPTGELGPRCHDGVLRVIEVHAGEADAVSVGDRLVME
jgi:uncharacterized membrane protein (UPF0127 family)